MFSFWWNSESKYIEWQLPKSYILSQIHVRIILSQKRQNNCEIPKRSHYRNAESNTKKWFQEISQKDSKKSFSTQLNSTAKTSRTAVFQESLALTAKLVDIFHIFHRCTILVYSICDTGSSWSLPTLYFGRVCLTHTGSSWKPRIFFSIL